MDRWILKEKKKEEENWENWYWKKELSSIF